MIYDISHETKHTFKCPFYLMHTSERTNLIVQTHFYALEDVCNSTERTANEKEWNIFEKEADF